MKKQLRVFIIFIIMVAIMILIFKIFNLQNVILRQIYPRDYSEYVEKYAEEYNVDPLLVYAIIKAESNFNANATSRSGAVGLMQIMEATGEEFAVDLGINYTTPDQLYEPEININIGVAYIAFLLERYDGNLGLAAIAYNAGMGNVEKWIEAGTIKSDGSDIENVPFKETNTYVRKILRDYEIYKDIYK